MTISLHETSINSYLQILGGMSACLDKGLTYFRENDIDPEEIVGECLIPDMKSFNFQVQAVAHHSIGAFTAVKDGTYVPTQEVPLLTYGELQKLILDAQGVLRQLSPEEINRFEGGEVIFRFGEYVIPFTTENFLISFSLPNFYFHAATAYDILRMKGAPVGKIDFLGQMRIKG